MKCEAFVLWVPARKRGSGAAYMKAKDIRLSWTVRDLNPMGAGYPDTSADLLAKGYVVCGGDIKVTVTADDEPYMGGTSAEMNVTTVCASCGCVDHPWAVEKTQYLGDQFVYLQAHILRSISDIATDWADKVTKP